MARKRKRRPRWRPPALKVPQILAWADAFHQACGRWPHQKSGRIAGGLGESWGRVNTALYAGIRSLPGGSSLAKLLAEHRGKRHPGLLPKLTETQILAWADAHHQRTGAWPNYVSGPVFDAPGEKWLAINAALSAGGRGLPGGDSLARLLARARGVRNLSALPRLTPKMILTWADDHHARTGRWPNYASGPLVAAPGENWLALDSALRYGCRGLPGGSSLARLLARSRGVRNQGQLPRLGLRQVLAWADAHHQRTGHWPNAESGMIAEAPGETWKAVDTALEKGLRGFPGGSTLGQCWPRTGVFATGSGCRGYGTETSWPGPTLITSVPAHGRWPLPGRCWTRPESVGPPSIPRYAKAAEAWRSASPWPSCWPGIGGYAT